MDSRKIQWGGIMKTQLINIARRFFDYLPLVLFLFSFGFYAGHLWAKKTYTPQIAQLNASLATEQAARATEKLLAAEAARQAVDQANAEAARLVEQLNDNKTTYQQHINQLKGKIHAVSQPIKNNTGTCRYGADFISLWNGAYSLPADSRYREASAPGSTDAAAHSSTTAYR